MSTNWAALPGLAFCGWLLLRGSLSPMWLEEFQTRLSRVPHLLIRLASRQIPLDSRDDCTDEWLAELAFVLRDTDGLPVTRFIRGTRFAVGLLRVARVVGRELSQDASQEALTSHEMAVIKQLAEGLEVVNGAGTIPARVGYRGPTACAAAGVTYRQLDYWARTGLVEPTMRPAIGAGSAVLYSFRDVLMLRVLKRLLDTGVSLNHVRAAIAVLRDWGTEDLAKVTLMSDGATVYDFTTPEEVYGLLQGGHGVFAIALAALWQEVEGRLAELPAERAS